MMFFVKDKLSSKQEEGVVKSEHKPYTGVCWNWKILSAFSFLLCLYIAIYPSIVFSFVAVPWHQEIMYNTGYLCAQAENCCAGVL